MGKEIVNPVQEVQRVPYRINPRRNTPRHIVIKLSKIKYKEKILEVAREKQQITYKGIPIRLTTIRLIVLYCTLLNAIAPQSFYDSFSSFARLFRILILSKVITTYSNSLSSVNLIIMCSSPSTTPDGNAKQPCIQDETMNAIVCWALFLAQCQYDSPTKLFFK